MSCFLCASKRTIFFQLSETPNYLVDPAVKTEMKHFKMITHSHGPPLSSEFTTVHGNICTASVRTGLPIKQVCMDKFKGLEWNARVVLI